jgi:hypothetical protein
MVNMQRSYLWSILNIEMMPTIGLPLAAYAATMKINLRCSKHILRVNAHNKIRLEDNVDLIPL